jgi:hypothetical protein
MRFLLRGRVPGSCWTFRVAGAREFLGNCPAPHSPARGRWKARREQRRHDDDDRRGRGHRMTTRSRCCHHGYWSASPASHHGFVCRKGRPAGVCASLRHSLLSPRSRHRPRAEGTNAATICGLSSALRRGRVVGGVPARTHQARTRCVVNQSSSSSGVGSPGRRPGSLTTR